LVFELQAISPVAGEPGVLKLLLGIHILVVDPDVDARELLEALLSYCGGFVTHAASTAEAVEIIARRTPDIVVMELSMAEADGVALRAIRGGRTDIPLVAVVAGRDHVDERIRRAGFQAYVRKPVDPWELCRIIASVARKP
jgi:CheY-like chemotaxis protein